MRFAKTAAWVWQDEEGAYHATRPFSVRQHMRSGDKLKIAAADALGRRVNFDPAAVAQIAPAIAKKVANSKLEVRGSDAYYVPHEYRLVSIGDNFSAMDEARVLDGLRAKQADEKGGKTLVARIGDRYRIRGEGTKKLAAAQKDLTRDEFMIFMASYGATKQAQESIVDHLKKNAQAAIIGLDWSVGCSRAARRSKAGAGTGAR